MVETSTTTEWTREEIIAHLEEEAKRRRGVSASELVRAYVTGSLENPGEVADLLALAWLLPEKDPLFDGVRSESTAIV